MPLRHRSNAVGAHSQALAESRSRSCVPAPSAIRRASTGPCYSRLAGGADVLELGYPFSVRSPRARRLSAGEAALLHGVTLAAACRARRSARTRAPSSSWDTPIPFAYGFPRLRPTKRVPESPASSFPDIRRMKALSSTTRSAPAGLLR